ncbi:hypothetical protein C8J56DRAFT_854429 [Mycena floridula]|nr:hypothetical protein C8J56DRAFT_854429 [Mycena floridula]
MAFQYLEPPNSNLICCICRSPFTEPVTTRHCSHTFCRSCILEAISHSAQCPVDRSSLCSGDLNQADPIIRSLVDELLVECPNTGCTHSCQRQLLVIHLKDCPFQLMPCSTSQCSDLVFRRDLDDHQCDMVTVSCESCGAQINSHDLETHRAECWTECIFCATELRSSDLSSHQDSCSLFVVSCPHSPHGCSWRGARNSLSQHISSCAYEAIKGFFPVYNSKMESMETENMLLKVKVEMLEGTLQRTRVELEGFQRALGPWYRPNTTSYSPISSELPPTLQPSSASGSQPSEFFFDSTPFLPSSDQPNSYRPMENSLRATHRHSGSLPQGWDQSGFPLAQSRPTTQQSVAPLDLSTTLEGTLLGLRESLVSVGASVDSLGRRSDIALSNETMRINEEVMSLRANIHGLRMQVHTMMVDRNAHATGRYNESFHGESVWPSIARQPSTSTKL